MPRTTARAALGCTHLSERWLLSLRRVIVPVWRHRKGDPREIPQPGSSVGTEGTSTGPSPSQRLLSCSSRMWRKRKAATFTVEHNTQLSPFLGISLPMLRLIITAFYTAQAGLEILFGPLRTEARKPQHVLRLGRTTPTREGSLGSSFMAPSGITASAVHPREPVPCFRIRPWHCLPDLP